MFRARHFFALVAVLVAVASGCGRAKRTFTQQTTTGGNNGATTATTTTGTNDTSTSNSSGTNNGSQQQGGNTGPATPSEMQGQFESQTINGTVYQFIQLTWKVNGNTTAGFAVEYRTPSGSFSAGAAVAPLSYFNSTNEVHGMRYTLGSGVYTFRVRACTSITGPSSSAPFTGCSAYSNEATVQMP